MEIAVQDGTQFPTLFRSTPLLLLRSTHKSPQHLYEDVVAKAVIIEERSDNGSGRFRLPALTFNNGTEFVTTVWPADNMNTPIAVHVHKLLFVSLIARVVSFKTKRNNPPKKLVIWCNCR